MEVVGVRNYGFDNGTVASIIVGNSNMYVVVRTPKWLFTMCPRIEVKGTPLVIYCKDMSMEYGGEIGRLYREYVGVAVDESTYRTYSDIYQNDLQRRYVDNYHGVSSDLVKKWADAILEKTQSNATQTIVMMKLDDSTFVQVIDNREHFLSVCDDVVFTYLYDGGDCCVTSSYDAATKHLYTRIGALALDEISREDRCRPTFQQRLVIGNAFKQYHEESGVNPKHGIWSLTLKGSV